MYFLFFFLFYFLSYCLPSFFFLHPFLIVLYLFSCFFNISSFFNFYILFSLFETFSFYFSLSFCLFTVFPYFLRFLSVLFSLLSFDLFSFLPVHTGSNQFFMIFDFVENLCWNRCEEKTEDVQVLRYWSKLLRKFKVNILSRNMMTIVFRDNN
jgi:hypothetical protein